MSSNWRVALSWILSALRFADWQQVIWHKVVNLQRIHVNVAQKYVMRALTNVPSIKMTIANNAQRLVANVQLPADRCKGYQIFLSGES